MNDVLREYHQGQLKAISLILARAGLQLGAMIFDLFALNRGTVEFFDRNFLADPPTAENVAGLIEDGNIPRSSSAYKIRENPLSYYEKLSLFNFLEIEKRFLNDHSAPALSSRN